MNNLKAAFTFGWPYLRRYKGRLLAGILFGILFGMANGSFIWATKTLVERLDPEKPVAIEKVGKPATAKITTVFKERLHEFKRRLDEQIDPWLPIAGGLFTWQRVLGGLFFLPLIALILSATDYLADYCMGWVSERVINDLRINVLAKLNTLSLEYFNRSTTGDLITRIHVDTLNLHKVLKDSCGDLIKATFQCLAVIVTLSIIDWKLTLFALVFLPVCLFPVIVLGRKARRVAPAVPPARPASCKAACWWNYWPEFAWLKPSIWNSTN